MSEMQKQEGETADIPVYDQDQQEKLIHILICKNQPLPGQSVSLR